MLTSRVEATRKHPPGGCSQKIELISIEFSINSRLILNIIYSLPYIYIICLTNPLNTMTYYVVDGIVFDSHEDAIAYINGK